MATIQKNESCLLTNDNGPIKTLEIYLGWKLKKPFLSFINDVHLDAVCFCADKAKNCLGEVNSYGFNFVLNDESIKHCNGLGKSHLEVLRIRFDKLNPDVSTIYIAFKARNTYGLKRIKSLHCNLKDVENNAILHNVEISDFERVQGMVLLKLSKIGNEWKATNLAKPINLFDGLFQFINQKG